MGKSGAATHWTSNVNVDCGPKKDGGVTTPRVAPRQELGPRYAFTFDVSPATRWSILHLSPCCVQVPLSRAPCGETVMRKLHSRQNFPICLSRDRTSLLPRSLSR